MSELLFSFKEGIKGFKRAKLSSFVSIVAIFISLTALGIFSILTFKLGKILNEIENKVELEAFIDEKLKEDEISNLKNNIKKIKNIVSCGRQGMFRYLDMHHCVDIGLVISDEIINKTYNFDKIENIVAKKEY